MGEKGRKNEKKWRSALASVAEAGIISTVPPCGCFGDWATPKRSAAEPFCAPLFGPCPVFGPPAHQQQQTEPHSGPPLDRVQPQVEPMPGPERFRVEDDAAALL